MKAPTQMKRTLLAISVLLCAAVAANAADPRIPRVWDDRAIASAMVPLAVPAATPVQIRSKYYYGIPVRPIYKSYPVYRPDREPAGYMNWLNQQEPRIAFDAGKFRIPEDWIKAGEMVFDAPIAYGHIFRLAGSDLYLRLPDWYRSTGAPLLKDGSMPFTDTLFGKKVRLKSASTRAGCATRGLMPGGTAIKGAQGNFPFDRAFAWDQRQGPPLVTRRSPSM